jgi:hypothetical protein
MIAVFSRTWAIKRAYDLVLERLDRESSCDAFGVEAARLQSASLAS